MKEAVLEFALLAAGAAGASFDEFRRWLSPWGWHCGNLSTLLHAMRDEGLAHLDESPNGEILRVRLTAEGEHLFSVNAKRRHAPARVALRDLRSGVGELAAPTASGLPAALQER